MDSNSTHSALCPGSSRTTTTTETTSSSQTSPTCSLAARPTTEMWTVEICPTIGGAFKLKIHPKENVEGLKRSISRKLKIPKEKISLLHRESILREGRLSDHGVSDGSCLKLLPNVESGLMSQKTENTVMQALENLSEGQVHEFLTGKSPLTLAMRLGDHMMFVQLQLSTNSPGYKRTSTSNHRCSKSKTSSSRSGQQPPPPPPRFAALAPTPAAAPPVAMRSSEAAVAPITSSVPGGPPPPSPLTGSPAPASPSPSPSVSPSPVEDMMRGARDSPSPSPGSSSSPASSSDSVSSSDTSDSELPILDSAALAQAKRNLQQKLKEISQLRGAQAKEQEAQEAGAIIESMQHLGHGVYSGTFSGALNPALQDRDGKPKRSISTIIHILNDLLGASPQYRAHLHASRRRRMAAASAAAAAQGQSTEGVGRLSQENEATRGKMEQLQMRLEERRQKRQARRQARACPYSWTGGDHQQDAANKTLYEQQKQQQRQHQQSQQPMEMDANLETTDVGSYDMSQQELEAKLKNETVVA